MIRVFFIVVFNICY